MGPMVDGIGEVAIVALVPGVVEVAKRAGLPARYAGLAAIVTATLLVALGDLAGAGVGRAPAGWALMGIVYGLAAAGLYDQVTTAAPFRRDPPDAPAPDA